MRRPPLFLPLLIISFFALSFLLTTSQAASPPPQEKPGKSATTTPTSVADKKKKTVAATPAATTKNPPKTTQAQQAKAKKSTVKGTTTRTTSASAKPPQRTKNTTAAQKPAPQSTGKATLAATPSGAAAQKKKTVRRTNASPPPEIVGGNVTEFEKQISSRSAIVMDADTGDEIFAKYPDNPRQPASTIKIVTAMIALKSLKQDEVIDVSDKAAGMPSSKIFLDPGKNYRANDLINAVLLASANDASVALAEKISGSEESFANLMTLSARMWGARNTVCRTASGLTALGQQSTARDLANLFRYAMQDDDFASRMHEKFISTTYGKVLRNHNKALWRLDGAEGGKTGYTIAARQTYVGQFTRDSHTIVVAIMGSESMWADLEKLVNYGFHKKKENRVARRGADSKERTTARVN
jgi:serine-type D-Ala-D-Ala carboxypeptidase (penicillin-binding protein 5/6)